MRFLPHGVTSECYCSLGLHNERKEIINDNNFLFSDFLVGLITKDNNGVKRVGFKFHTAERIGDDIIGRISSASLLVYPIIMSTVAANENVSSKFHRAIPLMLN